MVFSSCKSLLFCVKLVTNTYFKRFKHDVSYGTCRAMLDTKLTCKIGVTRNYSDDFTLKENSIIPPD